VSYEKEMQRRAVEDLYGQRALRTAAVPDADPAPPLSNSGKAAAAAQMGKPDGIKIEPGSSSSSSGNSSSSSSSSSSSNSIGSGGGATGRGASAVEDFEALLGAPMDLSAYDAQIRPHAGSGNGAGAASGTAHVPIKRERDEATGPMAGSEKKKPKVVIKMDED
jgi:hypothetical protein